MRCTLPALLLLGAIMTIAALLPGWLLARRFAASILEVETAPRRSVAIVFGAGIRSDGSPTRVLEDRVRTAADLYNAGSVGRILLSGASERMGHHETDAMLELALQLGIPRQDIWLDYAGTRTYETCARAAQQHSIKEAILVTQRFHLPRALLICEGMDMDVVGVSADRRSYSRMPMAVWRLREIPATLRAFWDLAFKCQPTAPPWIQENNDHGT